MTRLTNRMFYLMSRLLGLGCILFLSACVSCIHKSADFQAGKTYFEKGDFKKAFCFLLPAAVNGNPEAQYALGYLYFYGYGTPENPESGIFWMQRAALKNFPPAVHAIQMLLCQQAEAKPPVPTTVVPQPEPLIVGRSTIPIPPPNVLSRVKVGEPSSFATALQLMGDYDLNNIRQTQQQLGLQQSTMIGLTQHHDKNWYVLLYGKYASTAAAKLALSDLSKTVRDLHPWVRQMSNIEILTG